MTPVKTVPLGDVATIERSSVQPADIRPGTMYVGLEDIESGGGILSPRPVDPGDLASTKFSFTESHVLYGKLRPYLGKIAAPDFAGICSTDIVPLLPGPLIDRRYLLHFLRQPTMIAFASARSVGINLPRLSPSVLETFPIPLPPLPEQRRIAAILDQADALRVKRRKALAQSLAFDESLYASMFGEASRSSGSRSVPLGELIKLKSGGFLPASSMSIGGDHPVFGGNGINGYHDAFLFEDPKIVIGRVGAYCGAVHVAPPRSWITDNALYVAWHRDDLSFTYLAYALKRANLNQFASQSGQPLISGSRIYSVQSLVPPISDQLLFGQRLEAAEELRSREVRSLQVLDDLFASLQQRAFQGEL